MNRELPIETQEQNKKTYSQQYSLGHYTARHRILPSLTPRPLETKPRPTWLHCSGIWPFPRPELWYHCVHSSEKTTVSWLASLEHEGAATARLAWLTTSATEASPTADFMGSVNCEL